MMTPQCSSLQGSEACNAHEKSTFRLSARRASCACRKLSSSACTCFSSCHASTSKPDNVLNATVRTGSRNSPIGNVSWQQRPCAATHQLQLPASELGCVCALLAGCL